jgi:hypothetical protein
MRKRSKPMRRLQLTVAATVGSLLVAASPAAGSQGSISFHIAVSGKGHDNGTLSAGIGSIDFGGAFNGCVVVKHTNKSIVSLFGTYSLEVGINSPVVPPGAGIKPRGQGVILTIKHYLPGSVVTYKTPNVGGGFSINGHAYSVSGAYSSAQVRDGGRSGTYTDRQAYRLYPAKLNQQITGVTIHATWHCSTITNKTQSY